MGEPSNAGGTIVDGFLAISGSAEGGCGCAFSLVADFNATTQQPFCFIRSFASGSVRLDNFSVTSMVSFENIGYGVNLETCSAGVTSNVLLTTTGPLELEVHIEVEAESVFDVYICEGGSRSAMDFEVPYFGTDSAVIVRDGFGNVVAVHRGVVANAADGSVLLLGVYDHDNVDTTKGMLGETTVSGSFVLKTELEASGSYTFEMIRSQFGSTPGDYNGDGDVTDADLAVVTGSLGATFDDAEYSAGVDLDLDGYINQSEVDRAVGLIMKLVGTCDADLNSDDVLNFFDIALFMSYLSSSNPVADWNGDSLINFFDLSFYMTDFNQGCQ